MSETTSLIKLTDLRTFFIKKPPIFNGQGKQFYAFQFEPLPQIAGQLGVNPALPLVAKSATIIVAKLLKPTNNSWPTFIIPKVGPLVKKVVPLLKI